jgi:hypothetical protein
MAGERRKYTKDYKEVAAMAEREDKTARQAVRNWDAGVAAVRTAGGAGRRNQGVYGERESAGRRTGPVEEADNRA